MFVGLCKLSNMFFYFFFLALQPNAPPRFTRFLDHTQRRARFCWLPLDEWLARCRDLWQHITHTTNKHPCLRLDSNPRSQQASGRRPMPWTARPLGPACKPISFINVTRNFHNSIYSFYSFVCCNMLCRGITHQVQTLTRAKKQAIQKVEADK
jgi:hypothetical protein